MSVAKTGGTLLAEENTFNQNNYLVDMGLDLLTPSSTIIAYTEMLLEYANTHLDCQDFIPDIDKILTAGDQLSNLITQLLSNKDTQGKIDLEALTSTARHDLRTPINAIIGYGEILLEDLDAEPKPVHPEASHDLKKIVASAQRLLNLIDDLFRLKKSEPSGLKKPEEPKIKKDTVPTAWPQTADSSKTTHSGAEAQPAVTSEEDNSTTQPSSLLVVDDREANRDLFKRGLDKKGYHVETAENGLEAMKMIRAKDFDLVLLDVMMPEMDGFQVLDILKKDPELYRIPVIMTSALDEIESVVRCIEMGAVDYLQKPVKQVILNAKISATLDRKRLQDKEREYTKKLQEEQKKSEKLLLNILPKPIADRLKKDEDKIIADDFPDATVLFSDLVGFTEMSAGIPAQELVRKLNQIFLAFDDLTDKYGLEKIKTIGDAYMLVGGVPTERPDHVEVVAQMGLEMVQEIQRLNKENNNDFKIRVGIHTGPVVAGVIGRNKFIYDLWGDTVNTASRMESHGLANHIQVSESTYERIKDKFILKPRGSLDIKGKGKMVTYLLIGRKN